MKKLIDKNLRGKIAALLDRIKKLQGDPHYVALGMAIGVSVAITPTIPFHTIIAVAMAYIFKASRPAAILGVWVSNPLTVVFLYIACYKIGIMLFGHTLRDADTIKKLVHALENDITLNQQIQLFVDFFHTKLNLFFAMLTGGVILAIPGGIFSYMVTKNFIKKLNFIEKKPEKQEAL